MKTKQSTVSEWLKGRIVTTGWLWLMACLFVLGTFTSIAAESCPRTTIKFSEICYWPSNGQPQWVELINTGTESVDARGMELVSGTNSYSLPLGLAEVPTNGFILVYFDGGGTDHASFATTNLATLHSSITNFLGNPDRIRVLISGDGHSHAGHLSGLSGLGRASGSGCCSSC